MSYLDNEFFLLAVTFGVFFFSKLLQKKTGILLLNPILLTIAILIIFLKMPEVQFSPGLLKVPKWCIKITSRLIHRNV